MTFAITKSHFSTNDYNKIDWRLKPFLDGWKVIEWYKGKKVEIPGTWNAEIFPFNYYEVIKLAGDPNSKEEENEIELSLACGWRDRRNGMFDKEVYINLRIEGLDVKSGANNVYAEIIKCGGASMEVYFNGKLITNFTDSIWWYKIENGYQTFKISDLV